jgi:phosphoribosylformimino-5-aminoimidazole carboxamide ribotide isomerase
MIAIPAIDIMDGQCTRLLRGDFHRRTSYKTSPLSQAGIFQQAGLTHLHLVDLDGAKQGKPYNLKTLEEIAGKTNLQIDYGGGIRSIAHIADALNAGASQINLGTMLYSDHSLIEQLLNRFDSDKLIASVDVRQGKVTIKGWQEQTLLGAAEAISYLYAKGWRWFSVTDTARDGTLKGVDPELFKPLVKAFPNARIIGGGGVGRTDDLELMKECGLYAAIVGKAIFEGNITLDELRKYQSC